MPPMTATPPPAHAHASTATDDAPPFRYTAQLADRIERAWQERWATDGRYRVANPGQPGFDASKPKFYCLDMFPYPSGAGLHVGHPEGYTATDILCRYKRMSGFNVLHPMGWDAFGLPAEQYAIQTGVHPAVTTGQSIETFRRQLQRFGFCYDWSREVGTIDPGYYRWTQWVFLQLYDAWFDPAAQKARPISELIKELESGAREARMNPHAAEISDADKAREAAHGVGAWSALDARARRAVVDSYRLAYQGTTTVNWCPKLGTVLANDEVIDGRSERGGYPVLRKPLKQWMFRITAYADRLLAQLDTLQWPESTKTMQREWIGRSEGAEITFELSGAGAGALTVFTTRPDTLFGATYMVVAPEHPLCARALAGELNVDAPTRRALGDYVAWAKNRSDVERQQESKTKTGAFTGVHAVNPATGRPIPVWTADYVLMGYGTGAIMAVPAHDERDNEFARAFALPIVEVVQSTSAGFKGGVAVSEQEVACFSGQGVAVHSAGPTLDINGLATAEAKRKVIAWLESSGIGRARVNYKFRDWTFSRQRYWGEPFPIVFDDAGNHYPVEARALPVTLPELADYAPVESDDPQPLLAKATAWCRTTAGEAGVSAALLAPGTPVTRETNTMPGSAGSSWYFLRYCDPTNTGACIDKAVDAYWMNVDFYIGGSEHAVGHLLYSRFWQSALHDLGHVSKPEPFQRLFHQGMITSFAYERADGALVPVDQVDEAGEGRYVERATGQAVKQIIAKMSKSLKNVVNPDDVIEAYGADTFRLYEMAMGPLEASKPWNTKDIVGPFRFLQRLWRNCVDETTGALRATDAPPSPALLRQTHRTIAGVTADIEAIALHTGISKLIELNNELTKEVAAAGAAPRAVLDVLVRLLSPYAPHLAEELWQRLGMAGSVVDAPWPVADASLLVDAEVEVPVQVAGKIKARVMVPTGADGATTERLALADGAVQAALAGKTVKKVIVVPGKLVNIVAV
jgi:leucyl-tRNA synthetase